MKKAPPHPTASMILDELELILKKRGHPPRARPGAESSPPVPGEAEALAMFRGAVAAVEKAPDADAKLMAARVAMLDLHVTGLAFSGGGIRSGTFAVGFLQGLANQGLLGRFDYLSTVSGGGYAGGWLAAWLKHEGDVRNVERQLDFSRIGQAGAEREWFDPDRDPRPVVDEEPQPLRHLRSFSSYLFPRPGILSADLWSVIMIWIRNVSINMLLLFPLAMIAVLLGRLGVFFFDFLNADKFLGAGLLADHSPDAEWARRWAVGFLVAGALSAFVALMLNAECLPEFRIGPARRPRRPGLRAWGAVAATVVAALGLTASSRWLLQYLFEQFAGMAARFSGPGIVGNIVSLVSEYPDLLQPPSFLLVMVVFGIFMSMGALLIGVREGNPEWAFVRAAFLAGATGGLLYVLVLGMVRAFARMNRPDLMATFALPGALCIVIASTIVEVAIAGRAMKEGEREWWARYAARLAIAAVIWLVVMGSTLYLPGLFLYAGARARTAMASGWILSTALGVLTGKFVLPRLQAGGSGKALATLAAFAPPIFIAGLGGAVGLLAALLLNSPSPMAPNAADFPAFDYYLTGVRQTSGWLIAALMIGFGALAGIGFLLIDVNAFSLNAMYANRLARCYLGASRPVGRWKHRWGEDPRDMTEPVGAPSISDRPDLPVPPDRNPNPVTGFAADDDLPLIGLRIGREPTGGDAAPGERTYWGPHLLINTTMNLVAGHDLAWRSRKGESFLLSSLYCGAESVGYTKILEGKAAARNLTLGRAIAISGAAVDPNMRFYQSPALTALLAVFDARLGAWIQNPRSGGEWEARSPRFGGLLVTETLGGTDGLGPYVHLSDGGHFDNMGVYELIRRRCRYIVALDAGDEVDSSNSNLAILIRLCRIDFGVRIQIDTEALRPRGEERLARAHVAIGRIRYDDVDQGQLPGVLVYVKTSMTGDEPPDLQHYARRDTNFPYQPTDLRQSFDEEQFECYRCLGDHVATEVFQDAVHAVRDWQETRFVDYVPRLFSRIQARWGDPATVPDSAFLESVRPWADLQRDLASESSLARLSRQLYPEIAPAPPVVAGTPAPDYDRAEVHAVGRMLQIMEDTWLSLELRRTTDLPINRGWLNSFRRWASTPAFQALWPLLRPEFGSEFVRFCEDELHMIAAPTALVPIDPAAAGDERTFQDAAIGRLVEEHTREWGPDPDAPKLADLIERSKAISPKSPPAWLIVQQPSAQEGPDGKPIGLSYVLGIVLVAKFPDPAGRFPGLALDGEPREFFVWMRRGFRATEMGAPMVREVLTTKLGPALGLKPGAELPPLLARYPKAGEQGDVDHEREAWLTFLARFDFRRVVPRKPGAWHSTLLRRFRAVP
ncbi:patatin-like phospholipase family protein [Aquisphaera insulae]|uniref:patatin-like phospholipase family protein n=1 Tax=Aquisphaera insulae TaxID=2712864 RepID=UPI0013EC84DE|nr:patatin-like phospholipase family protein [Aquisphaera insulae]